MPEELTRTARKLSEDVRKLVAAEERHRKLVERSSRRSKVGIVVGIVGVAVAGLATFYAVDARGTADTANDTAKVVHDVQVAVEQERNAARVASCVQSNIALERSRAALKLSLATLAPASISPAQQAQLDRYNAAVDEQLQYRDCSTGGIATYLSNPPKDPAVR